METRSDGSAVSPGGLSGLPGSKLAAPAVDASAFLAELARAVERDLSTPDHAPATERAYAHDWADFATFCGRHALEPLPAAPQCAAHETKGQRNGSKPTGTDD